MADNVFARNPPLQSINKFLQRNHQDYLSQTEDPAIIHFISKFFYEVEAVVGLLEDKFCDLLRNRDIQQLIGTKSIAMNALKKMHAKIIRRLHTTPSMVTPLKGEFTLDFLQEVFLLLEPYNSMEQLWT